MKLYKDKFMKHDKKPFERRGEIAELHWKRMVDDMLKAGKLKNCIVVCDVSCSMRGIPIEVSVALGILVSELSKDPWKGKVITFGESPQLHLIEGDDQATKTKFVRNMDWEATPTSRRDSRLTPVCMDQDGVALVSGFSKNLLKMFLNNDGQINQDSVMLDAISGEEYQKLVVVD
ncbi:hypothetical protein CRG98_008184 [Punica granatum]|uniref:DUF7788 domain-containing protein n=1 Tax=Punica granatum TaxID=22663 RepID=A0A2I0KSF4_PUNGR|nr:hypothetical protein CRG98_008184 [Punica granatum]